MLKSLSLHKHLLSAYFIVWNNLIHKKTLLTKLNKTETDLEHLGT